MTAVTFVQICTNVTCTDNTWITVSLPFRAVLAHLMDPWWAAGVAAEAARLVKSCRPTPSNPSKSTLQRAQKRIVRLFPLLPFLSTSTEILAHVPTGANNAMVLI